MCASCALQDFYSRDHLNTHRKTLCRKYRKKSKILARLAVLWSEAHRSPRMSREPRHRPKQALLPLGAAKKCARRRISSKFGNNFFLNVYFSLSAQTFVNVTFSVGGLRRAKGGIIGPWWSPPRAARARLFMTLVLPKILRRDMTLGRYRMDMFVLFDFGR